MSNTSNTASLVEHGQVRISVANPYGIEDDALRYMVCNQFYYDKTYSASLCKYFVIQWTPAQALRAILNGTIYHQSSYYQVIFHNCTRRDVSRAVGNADSHCKLSFRFPKNEFDCDPVVLIKLYNQTLLT